MSFNQAKKGGEQGVNGEWYEGGQFLPSSETTVKGAQKPDVAKATKAQIAPYVWEPAPYDDAESIFARIGHFCTDNRRECQYVKGSGFVGFRLVAPHPTYTSIERDDYDFETGNFAEVPHSQDHIDYIQSLIDRYNSGDRWFPLSEDRYHYKNQK